MKTILCYGDSNTWGWNAATLGRYKRFDRWPGVLQQELGNDFYIIEEGLNGRTTVWDDPIEEHKNGKTYLLPCLETHKPLDLVILMLGTNDLKQRFSLSPYDVAQGCATLIRYIQTSTCGPNLAAPQVLLMAPAPVGALVPPFDEMFAGAQEKSSKLSAHYQTVANEHQCHFADIYPLVEADPTDGIHLKVEAQHTIGKHVAELIPSII